MAIEVISAAVALLLLAGLWRGSLREVRSDQAHWGRRWGLVFGVWMLLLATSLAARPLPPGLLVALLMFLVFATAGIVATAFIGQLVASGAVVDPMRFSSEAVGLERDHGVVLVEWRQSEQTMTVCSERLHGLVVEQRLRHPGVAELNRHVANAVARPTPRGWRLVKSAEAAQIDALISLAMTAERASQPVYETKFHGFL